MDRDRPYLRRTACCPPCRATDDARLQTYAYDVAARAHAMDRQDRATGRAIEQAQAAFADVDDRTDTYAYFFSAGQLASTESVCYLQLGQADKGIEAAKRSLAGIDGSSFSAAVDMNELLDEGYQGPSPRTRG